MCLLGLSMALGRFPYYTMRMYRDPRKYLQLLSWRRAELHHRWEGRLRITGNPFNEVIAFLKMKGILIGQQYNVLLEHLLDNRKQGRSLSLVRSLLTLLSNLLSMATSERGSLPRATTFISAAFHLPRRFRSYHWKETTERRRIKLANRSETTEDRWPVRPNAYVSSVSRSYHKYHKHKE